MCRALPFYVLSTIIVRAWLILMFSEQPNGTDLPGSISQYWDILSGNFSKHGNSLIGAFCKISRIETWKAFARGKSAKAIAKLLKPFNYTMTDNGPITFMSARYFRFASSVFLFPQGRILDGVISLFIIILSRTPFDIPSDCSFRAC